METEKQKKILVRVPKELHKKARLLSVQTGQPLQQVLEKLLAEWTAKTEKQVAQQK